MFLRRSESIRVLQAALGPKSRCLTSEAEHDPKTPSGTNVDGRILCAVFIHDDYNHGVASGAKRYFVHSPHNGQRFWKIVGRAGSLGVDEARDRARTLVASIRGRTDAEAVSPADIPFETVGDEVFRRCVRNWKPSTLRVNRGNYRNQILPRFEGRPVADITAHDVQRWFASLHETPVAADRSAPILSVIMRQAEVYGYRPEGSNPCVVIKRYRRHGRERFLSAAEIRRLGEVLARHEAHQPQVVAIVRLL